jgi:hypothetical protein
VSVAESSALLHQLASVEVSVQQVERAAEALGAEIAADQRSCVEKMSEAAPTMYLGLDGYWAMALPGFGTPPRNCSLKPLRSSIGIMPKRLCTEPLNRSSAPPAKTSNGQRPRCTELDDGQLHAIVHALRAHAAASAEASPCALYIFRHRARMRYPKFHAQGLGTSAGVLEAGCKLAIGTRLKRSGHWTLNGANAIIALRCSKLRGRFEDFWERRTDRAAQ